jgi:hypothetical protein
MNDDDVIKSHRVTTTQATVESGGRSFCFSQRQKNGGLIARSLASMAGDPSRDENRIQCGLFPMYFWRVENLKSELASRPMTDREVLPYLVVESVLTAQAIALPVLSFNL